jgi:hypothetical protein
MANFTRFGNLSSDQRTFYTLPAADATGGAITYTVAQMFQGLIIRNGGGAVSDVTPTAAALVAAIDNCAIGDSWEFAIENDSAGATNITLTGGTNVTIVGTATVAQLYTKRFLCVVTAVATPAVSVYSLGTAVH